MTDESEGLQAARQAREEEKLKTALSRGGGPRAGDGGFGQKGKKGKDWKGSGKGGTEEGNKGKGGDHKKDPKTPWQKKDK